MYGLFKNNEQLGPLHSTKEGVMAEAFSHGAVAKMGVPDFPDQPDRSGELVLMNGFSVREVTAPLDLDAIRERVERYKRQPSELHPYSLWTQAAADITALLGEVDEWKKTAKGMMRAKEIRNTALDEAAEAVEEMGRTLSPTTILGENGSVYKQFTPREIAAAIKALKGDQS